ncbi:hypothetical protein V1525DRAFT_335355 [Lipomyces kononenkoae]|uniref:Uncharacterized protein n=1 Tax=Lipomyces kononenkoae TaxID=34357 RepID=A0ACC3TAN6_LIPKO
MSEASPSTHAEAEPPLSAADKARLRRERREAKILAGGTDRLNKITNVAHNTSTPYKQHVVPQSMIDDPPELAPDLASPTTLPSRGEGGSSSTLPENAILKLLAAGRQQVMGAEGGTGPQTPDAVFEDFVKQSALGNNAGDGSDFDFFSAMMNMARSSDGSQTPGSPTSTTGSSSTGSIPSNNVNLMPDRNRYWRTAHAVSIIILALFSVSTRDLRGSQLSRAEDLGNGNRVVMLYFATIELVLQSGRFLIEKGRSPSKSMFTKVAGYIPAPYSAYLLLVARYTHIATNIVQDFCLLVFLLGINEWWHGI